MTDSIFEPDEGDGSGTGSRDELRRVARYQRLVLYAVLANLITNILLLALNGAALPIRMAGLGLALAVACFAMFAVFQLTRQLYNPVLGVVCALLMFVPCISLIVLVVINGKATAFLQQHKVRVGFLGADPDSI